MTRLIFIVLSVVLISGCSLFQSDEATNQPPQEDQDKIELETTLQVKQESDKAVFELSLHNKSTALVNLPFSTTQEFEISVKDEQGKEVYRYSIDQSFLTALQNVPLNPGEALTWQEEWDYTTNGQLVENGKYTAAAAITLHMDEFIHAPMITDSMITATQAFTIDLEQANPRQEDVFRQVEISGGYGQYTVTGEARVFEAMFGYAVSDGHVYYVEDHVMADKGAPDWGEIQLQHCDCGERLACQRNAHIGAVRAQC